MSEAAAQTCSRKGVKCYRPRWARCTWFGLPVDCPFRDKKSLSSDASPDPELTKGLEVVCERDALAEKVVKLRAEIKDSDRRAAGRDRSAVNAMDVAHERNRRLSEQIDKLQADLNKQNEQIEQYKNYWDRGIGGEHRCSSCHTTVVGSYKEACTTCLREQLTAKDEQIAGLRTLLWEWSAHLEECRENEDGPDTCDCGLSVILERALKGRIEYGKE